MQPVLGPLQSRAQHPVRTVPSGEAEVLLHLGEVADRRLAEHQRDRGSASSSRRSSSVEAGGQESYGGSYDGESRLRGEREFQSSYSGDPTFGMVA